MKTIQSPLKRRDFIRITAVAASAAGLAACSERGLRTDGLSEVRETRLLMGTLANLTVHTTDAMAGRRAVETTFDVMQSLESKLSRSEPASQLSQLNRTGTIEVADPALLAVLESSISYSMLTNGAFDITVEPILAQYREAAARSHPPNEIDVESLLERVDYRYVDIDAYRVQLTGQKMAITLDGIAKGFVIDEGAKALTSRGFDQILVEVGGDLITGSPLEDTWQIGIRSSRPGTSELIGTAGLRQQALATSGDYLNSFTQDYRLHHILDPRQGVSPVELSSVSVVGPTAMDADAISTSLMVLGTEAGLQLVERLPGVEALLIEKNQSMHASSGFPLMGKPAS